MKKTCIIRILFVFVGLFGFIASSQALFLDKILKSPSLSLPTFDVPQDAVTIGKSLQQTFLNASKTKNQIQSDLDNLQSAINSVLNFSPEAMLDSALNPGARSAESCKINNLKVDIYNPDDVEKALTLITLKEPDRPMLDAFKENKSRFLEANILDILTASRELNAYLDVVVEVSLEELKKSVTEGGNGSPAPEAGNETALNEKETIRAMDNLLELLEKVVALKAQLRAVQALKGGVIQPEKYTRGGEDETQQSDDKDSDGQSAALEVLGASRQYAQSIPLAFAQLSSSKAVETASKAEISTLSASSQRQLKYLSQTLDFVEAPESDVSHAFYDNAEQMDEMNKLEPINRDIQDAISAHNMIHNLPEYKSAAEGYNKIVEQHKKAVEAVKASQKCVQQFVDRRYNNALSVVNGGVSDATAYEQMKGIGGWAIDAFETAKAAQVTTDTIGDEAFSGYDYDPDVKLTADLVQDNDVYQKVSKQNTSSGSPARQEQSLKESRETMLIPWEVGAEASKMLAASPQDWGDVKSRFPIWTDTKSFYNQYLNGKYENIETLLKSFSANDVLALIVAKLQGIDKQASETRKQKEFVRLDEELSAETQKSQQQYDAEYNNHLSQQNTSQSALQQRRAALATQLEAAAAEYKEVTDEISDTRQQIEEDSINNLREEIMYIEPFPTVTTEDKNASLLPSGGYGVLLKGQFGIASAYLSAEEAATTLNSRISTQKENSKLDELKEKEKTLDNKVGKLKKELEALDELIAQEKLESQKKVQTIQSSAKEKILSLKNKFSKAKDELEESFGVDAATGITLLAEDTVAKQKESFLKKFGETAVFNGPTAASLTGGLASVIENALDALYAQVDARIKLARSQLAKLGDNLYDPAYHEQVVEIHKSLITDLKAMVLTINYSGLGVASKIFLYETLLTADTSPETEGYFVGAVAKERDLKAPMPVPGLNLPPLREVVHFDDIDFQNVKPYDEKRKVSEPISREDFLNYGREIPAIWKMILQNRAFVEKDLNLKALLNEGCTQVAFFRGGFMPCRVKGGSVIVDVNSDGKYIKGSAAGSLNECPYLEMRGGQVFNTLYEQNVVFSPSLEKRAAQDCTYSELGTLLDADENGTLYLRQTTYDAYRDGIETMKKMEKSGGDYDAPPLTHAYGDAMLNTNQFGDYLRYVENEQGLRRHKEEVKQDYEDNLATLKELLLKYGYIVPADFDIIKSYDEVRRRLDTIKNTKVKDALEKIEDVAVEDNEPVATNVDRYKRVISALQKDKDEMTAISDLDAENNHLDEDLKSAKVNNEVADKYGKHLDNMADEQSKISATPYCAIY